VRETRIAQAGELPCKQAERQRPLPELVWLLAAVMQQQSRLTCDAHATSIERMPKMIQLRNVPDSLHRQLKARAALAGMPLSDFLIREVRKIAEYPTPEEMRERLAQRDAYRGKASPTDILRAERDSR
jgi:antitoxin FitA